MSSSKRPVQTISGYKKINYKITPSAYQESKEPLNPLSLSVCLALGAFKVLIASLARVVFFANNAYSREVGLFLLFCYASAFIQLCNCISEILRRYFKSLQVVNDFFLNVNFYVTTFYLKIAVFYMILSFGDVRQQYTTGYLCDFFIFICTRVYCIKFRFGFIETVVAVIFSTGIKVLTYCILVPEHPALFGVYCFTMIFNALWALLVDKYYERDYYYEMRHLSENQTMKAALVGKKTGIFRLQNEKVLSMTSYCSENYEFLFDLNRSNREEIREEPEINPIAPRSEDFPEIERFEYEFKTNKYLVKNFFFDLENSCIPDNIRKAEMKQIFNHIKNINQGKSKVFNNFTEIGTKKISIDSYSYKILEFSLRIIEDINEKDDDIFEFMVTDVTNYEQLYRTDLTDKELLKSCIDKGLTIPLKTINIINDNIKNMLNNSNSNNQKELNQSLTTSSAILSQARLSANDAQNIIQDPKLEPLQLAKTDLRQEVYLILNTLKLITKSKQGCKIEIDGNIDEAILQTLFMNKNGMTRTILNLILALIDADNEGKIKIGVFPDKQKVSLINFAVTKTRTQNSSAKNDGLIETRFINYMCGLSNSELKVARSSSHETVYQFALETYMTGEEKVQVNPRNRGLSRFNDSVSNDGLFGYNGVLTSKVPETTNNYQKDFLAPIKGGGFESVRQSFIENTVINENNQSVENQILLTDPANKNKSGKSLAVSFKVKNFQTGSFEKSAKLCIILLESDVKVRKYMVDIIQDQSQSNKNIYSLQVIECSNIIESLCALFQCINANVKVNMIIIGGSMKSIPLSQYSGVVCSPLVISEFYQVPIYAIEATKPKQGNNSVCTFADKFSNSVFKLMLDNINI